VLYGAAKEAAEKAEIVISIGIPRGLKSPRNDKNKKLAARLKPRPFKKTTQQTTFSAACKALAGKRGAGPGAPRQPVLGIQEK
jgi:hypothetical protein